MFARINRMGTVANEAEIRRGSLPGPVTTLILELAEDERFAALTPLSSKAVNQREREELVTRFFAYLNTYETEQGRFPGYKDRPKKFLYDYLKVVNVSATQNPDVIESMRNEFYRMLDFVARTFELGFRKVAGANTVPRVRFEAIAIGSALVLRQNPGFEIDPQLVTERMLHLGFDAVVVSDGSNVRSKLEGRIDLVVRILTE
jgi:hypothetical protein